MIDSSYSERQDCGDGSDTSEGECAEDVSWLDQ